MRTNGIGGNGIPNLRRPIGSFRCKLDDKGRLSLPRSLARRLDASVLYLVPTLNKISNHRILRIFTPEAWDRMLAKLPPEQKDPFVNHTYEANLDSSGRILIPQKLRQQVEIDNGARVVIVNHDDHIRLWRAKDFDALPIPTV